MNEKLDPFREWDAAYVLGSLGMDERRKFESHLAKCEECSASVSELVGLPGILNKISAEDAVELLSSPLGVDASELVRPENSLQLLANAAIKRRAIVRRRYVGGLSIAAGLILVIGIGIGNSFLDSTVTKAPAELATSSGVKINMVELVPNVMTVNLHATKKRWGTSLEWTCAYAESRTDEQMPESYDLVITDSSGAKRVVATWLEIGEGAKGLGAATSIPFDSIRAIEVRASGATDPIMRAETLGI
jgi:hypothetical protein